ncbi:MAG: hypothetical protein LQ351_006751 [Letrouitia transgressa]|nr:MAG: hypothetical protein LQ351_006751 [Letrouitia transgressa]
MPGGKWEKPFYTPYALYGTIDYIYGWPAYEANNGFTAAQASMNVLESLGYCGYLWIIWKYGGKGRRSVGGGWGGLACLLGFSLSVMTFAKTVIYFGQSVRAKGLLTPVWLYDEAAGLDLQLTADKYQSPIKLHSIFRMRSYRIAPEAKKHQCIAKAKVDCPAMALNKRANPGRLPLQSLGTIVAGRSALCDDDILASSLPCNCRHRLPIFKPKRSNTLRKRSDTDGPPATRLASTAKDPQPDAK